MAWVTVDTHHGRQRGWVCDWCRAAFVLWTMRYCSGRCAGNAQRARERRLSVRAAIGRAVGREP